MWVAKADGSTPKLWFWYSACNFYTNVFSGRVRYIVGKNILSIARPETSRSDTALLTKTAFEFSAEPSPDLNNLYSSCTVVVQFVQPVYYGCTICTTLANNCTICTARVQLSYNLSSPCTLIEQSLQPVYNNCKICAASVKKNCSLSSHSMEQESVQHISIFIIFSWQFKKICAFYIR